MKIKIYFYTKSIYCIPEKKHYKLQQKINTYLEETTKDIDFEFYIM